MFPYFLLIFFPFLAALFSLGKRDYNGSVLFGIIFLVFVLIVAFTDGNGLDWYGTSETEGYALVDFRFQGFEGLKRYEPGFVFVNLLLGDFHFFLFVMSVTCFLMVWDVIRKNCSYKYIGLFVYIVTMALYCYMGVYRHAIAQTILIYSWKFIDDKKKLSLLILTACMFHYSAAIAFLYFLIPKDKYLSLSKCSLVMFVVFLIRPYILPIVGLVSFFMPGETAGKIDLYLNADDYGAGLSIPLLVFKLFIFLSAYYYLRNNKNSINCFLVNTYVISIILYLTISFSPSFGRLVLFFSCSEILLVPITINQIIVSTRVKRCSPAIPFSYFVFVLGIYMYTYFSFIMSYSEIYLPYKSILF